MDAVIAALRLLWRLLFYRPFNLILPILVYAVMGLAFVGGDPAKRGVAVTVMAAFVAGGLVIVLTERIIRFSLQAGAIGLPGHARMMRRVQACFLVIFVGAPAVLAVLNGASPLDSLAVLTGATAAGTLLAEYGVGWILLAPLLGWMMPQSWWGRAPEILDLALVGCVFLVARWFELPWKSERAGAFVDARLADARHERRGRAVGRAPDPEPRKDAAVVLNGISPSPSGVGDREANRQITALLALGLGYSVRTNWRGVIHGAGITVVALAAWQLLHPQTHNPLAYTWVTAMFVFRVAGRLQLVLRRWMQTTTEQALLWLTPGRPPSRLIKRALIVSTLTVQRGTIVTWAVASLVGAAFGWVDRQELGAGFLVMLAVFLAFTPVVWAVLAQRRVRTLNLPAILSVLMVGAGTVVVFWDPHAVGSVLIGALLMVAPSALALAWYTLAPLRFPLSVDPGALKAGI